MNVAVIPARGGSKRIPRKNIRPFMGKPIIAYSLDAARASGVFDRIIVTTDDAEIADVAREHGAEVPFMRPKELSDDRTGTHEVVGHAVRWLIEHGDSVTAACSIYATAPFIEPSDLRRGLAILEGGHWESVLAATTFPFPIFRAFEQTSTGGLRMVFPQHYHTRSQDLPVALHDAGQFAWATAQTWLAPPTGFSDKMTTVLLPRWRVQDIDSAEDWERAEMIWRMMHPSP